MGLFGFKSCQIIGIFVRLECGRRRFDVSCLGIVGLHMGGHELFMHRSIETPVPRPPGLGGDLTHPKPGFNALLTARWPRWAVDLTNCQ